MKRTRLLALGALFVLAACGRKGPPVAPELVVPRPPEDLTATAVPEGVHLAWKRPTRYSGGGRMQDLERFTIERAPGDGETPTFARVHELVLDDRTRFRKERRLEWTDTSAEPGRRYLYRVVAVTFDGYHSPFAGPVGARAGRARDVTENPPP